MFKFNNVLSSKIRQLRKENRITQVELASIIDVKKQTISNWENNNIAPSIEMLIRLATYFNVSTDYLLGLDKKEHLNITGLSKIERMHIQNIVNDFLALKKKR